MDLLLRRRMMMAPPAREEYIIFADPVVEQICATNWGDGVGITPTQAAAVTNSQFGTTFRDNTSIVSFDEFAYFSGLTQLSNYAFSGCTALESIMAPSSIQLTGQYTFSGCTALKDYADFPGASAIGNFMYKESGLTSLQIPSHVTSIGGYAFYLCQGLVGTLVIPSTITTMGNNCFQGCAGIQECYINCATIGSSFLRDCTSLQYVEVAANCTSIGASAFRNAGATSAKCTFVIRATAPPTLGDTAVFTANRVNKIYVPSGSVNAYKTASNWSTFASYIEAIPS